MTRPAKLAEDARVATLTPGESAELVTEYMPGRGETVINTGLTTVYLGTSSGVTERNGLPLFPGTSVPWTLPGELWAIADPGGQSNGRVMVTSMVGGWNNPAATAAAIAGLTLTVDGDVQLTGPIDVTGSTVNIGNTVDVSGSSVGVSGTVGVSGIGGVVNVDASGSTVDVSGSTVGVSGPVNTNTTIVGGAVGVVGTVPVSGTVGVSGTVPVSGTVGVAGTVTTALSGTANVAGTVGISTVASTVTVQGTVTTGYAGVALYDVIASGLAGGGQSAVISCASYSALSIRASGYTLGTANVTGALIVYYANAAGTKVTGTTLVGLPDGNASAMLRSEVKGPYFRVVNISAANSLGIIVYGTTQETYGDEYIPQAPPAGDYRRTATWTNGTPQTLTDQFSGRAWFVTRGGMASIRCVAQTTGYFGYRFIDAAGTLRNMPMIPYPTGSLDVYQDLYLPPGCLVPIFQPAATTGAGVLAAMSLSAG